MRILRLISIGELILYSAVEFSISSPVDPVDATAVRDLLRRDVEAKTLFQRARDRAPNRVGLPSRCGDDVGGPDASSVDGTGIHALIACTIKRISERDACRA